jgi:pyrroline-5-carboxylate reductase
MGTETNKQVGFLGAGAIAEVFVRRLLGCELISADRILVYDTNEAILARLAGSFGAQAAASNRDVVAGSAIVFIAVPPVAVLPVLREVASALRKDHLVFSLAAGVSIARMEEAIGKPVPVIRTIPNTPAWIGQGMTPFCVGNHVGSGEREEAMALLQTFGRIAEVPEGQMAIATALTAVGPTYIFPVIAALADGAVTHGLPPATALAATCQGSRRRRAACAGEQAKPGRTGPVDQSAHVGRTDGQEALHAGGRGCLRQGPRRRGKAALLQRQGIVNSTGPQDDTSSGATCGQESTVPEAEVKCK